VQDKEKFFMIIHCDLIIFAANINEMYGFLKISSNFASSF